MTHRSAEPVSKKIESPNGLAANEGLTKGKKRWVFSNLYKNIICSSFRNVELFFLDCKK